MTRDALFTRLFWAWLVGRTAAWVLAAAASHPNAPLDLVEWLSWGGSWQWGYHKHPPLPAWMADAAARLHPGHVWPVYALSYAVTAGLLVAVWKLAREYLPAPLALFAVLCQDGQLFLTNDAAEFSNNVVLNAGWAWLALAVHRAVFRRSIGWWAGVGVALGLTLLAKYTILLEAGVLVAFTLVHPAARGVWRTPGPYLAAAVAAAIVAPHVLWLFRHDFVTVKYAGERTAGEGGWVGHLVHPVQFVGGEVIVLVPVVVALLPLLTWRRRREPSTPESRFLWWAVAGPVLVLLAFSAVTGRVLRDIWGSPLWPFVGVLLLVQFRRADAEARWRAATACWAAVAVLFVAFTVVKQTAGPALTHHAERPHFPGRALADEVNRRWAERYGGVPPIVGGEGWRAGNVCCYSAHRPVLFSSGQMGNLVMREGDSPWTSDADLNARGGAIVWDADAIGGDTIEELHRRFPAIAFQPDIELPMETIGVRLTTRVGLAFVPPGG